MMHPSRQAYVDEDELVRFIPRISCSTFIYNVAFKAPSITAGDEGAGWSSPADSYVSCSRTRTWEWILPVSVGHVLPKSSEAHADHFIALDRDPLFMGIAGHDDPALDLRADEAVVIVGGRIKQMAEDLFAGPFFRGTVFRGTVFRRTGFGGSGGAGVGVSETGKLGRYASEDPPKFFDGGFKRFHNRLYRSWRGPPSTYGKFRRQG